MSNILRRGRLQLETDEEMKQYTSSMLADKWIFEADIFIDLAHTLMLENQKIIKKDDCKKILAGLLKIKEEGMEKLDFDYEDIHISLEARLIELTGEDSGGRMHSGRSRNDEVATCIRFALRDELIDLMYEMIELQKSLIKLSKENTETVMPGFTHLQHAQPTTFAHHVLAHSNCLERDILRLIDAYERVNINPLGSAAFASTGFPLDRDMTTKLLGFSKPMENSKDAVSSRDFLIETASVLANISINLSKMSEEIVIWSSQEFDFIELDDKYASTSSIMPQKKNPDTAELMRGKTGDVVGSLVALLTICKGLPMSYNRDLQEANPKIQTALKTTRASVRIMTKMTDTLKVKKERMFEQSNKGFTTATELADTLVRKTDIPFRTAHQIIGILTKENREPNLKILDEISKETSGFKLSERGLKEEDIKIALDPVENVAKRKIIGGPAPDTIKAEIKNKQKRMEKIKSKVEDLDKNVQKSLDNLICLVNQKINEE
ncbi:MAG: argininosuccinate lyase [Methanosarcinaceae archaeon]|nr:argininosuccinate lyase [Methanosarcinaceae archaeon]